MATQKDTPGRLLDSAARLAKKVLRECEAVHSLEGAEGAKAWIFALFARQIGSVASVHALLAVRQPWDAILVMRSMYDAFFLIGFILNTSRPRSEVMELFLIEMAVDLYDELEFVAAVREKSIQQLVATDPLARERADHYAWAKRHPAFAAKKGPNIETAVDRLERVRDAITEAAVTPTADCRQVLSEIRPSIQQALDELSLREPDAPKRLRYLRADELRATMNHLWNPLLQYLVKSQGDSAAHSRFAAIANFVQKDEEGNVRLVMKPLPTLAQDSPTILLCAFICVLLTTDTIVDRFGFGDPLAASVSKLHKRWRAMAKGAAG